MQIKLNTKEKFTIISPIIEYLTDNFAQELIAACENIFEKNDIKNVVLNLKSLVAIDVDAINKLVDIQEKFYEHNYSFVICEMTKTLEDAFDKQELLEVINATPTESEAYDIVQFEEIERELFDGEE